MKDLPEQQVLYWRVPASPEHILKIAELSVEQLARVIVNIRTMERFKSTTTAGSCGHTPETISTHAIE